MIKIKVTGLYSQSNSDYITSVLLKKSKPIRIKVFEKMFKEVRKSMRIRLQQDRTKTAQRSNYVTMRPQGSDPQYDSRYGNVSMKDLVYYKIDKDGKKMTIFLGGQGRVDARLRDQLPEGTVTTTRSQGRYLVFFSYMFNRWYRVPQWKGTRQESTGFFTKAVNTVTSKIETYLKKI